jgi:hypothetical protein
MRRRRRAFPELVEGLPGGCGDRNDTMGPGGDRKQMDRADQSDRRLATCANVGDAGPSLRNRTVEEWNSRSVDRSLALLFHCSTDLLSAA